MKEYLRLLAKRESKEVLGKRKANLWLLTAVLVATFLSIAFSNGSMLYLSEKMNDPFTNWVDINQEFRSNRYEQFRYELMKEDVQKRFLFDNVQSDHYNSLMFIGEKGSNPYLKVRFFEQIGGELVDAILSDDNVVNGVRMPAGKLVSDNTGFILTADVVKKLGYSTDSVPPYINYMSYSPGADTLGVKLVDDFAAAPMPVLAVVKRLPGNMDMIASQQFLQKKNDDISFPLDLNNLDYQRSLLYFVPENIPDSEFEDAVTSAVPDSIGMAFSLMPDDKPQLASWMAGHIVSVFFDSYGLPVEVYQATAANIEAAVGEKGVTRLYDYAISDRPLQQSNYISVIFNSLDSIRAFERFAKDGFQVQIEMSQVSAKENFNAVSVMANIISWAMIIFSMVCIIMFIVNMLQSYFQKVKRNMGTFKAFGISSGELIGVYVLIITAIVVTAILIAILLAWLVEMILPVLGVMKDGEYNYLSLWSVKTLMAVVIMLVATVVTVWRVMSGLLRRTPGDLIYDR